MTIDEAIAYFKRHIDLYCVTGICREAEEMAIQALEQEPCEDAISREAVCDYIAEFINHEYSTQSECEMVDSMIDGIQHMPPVKPQEPKWIPVSERLPDNNNDVLVYDYSDIFVAWYSGIDGNWCSADNRFDEYTPIIAWQPLPEPYEPQERSE